MTNLLLGGSPCQGFSFAGKQLNFDDPRSKLFFEYVRVLKKMKPTYFLLENVKMKKEYQDVISEALGAEPIEINSALVSAQNRKRLYWTNIPGVTQPVDGGCVLKDIIDKRLPFNIDYTKYDPMPTKNYIQFDVSGRGYKSQQDRAYYIDGKFGCFPNARAITKRKITDVSGKYRDLTLTECELLQTLPPYYTKLEQGFSINKSLHAIGNGWTVDVIAHILSFIPETHIDYALSLFDGMSCGQLALHRANKTYGTYYASELDKYAMQVTQANFPDTVQIGDVRGVLV